jgi:TIR domain
MIERTYPPAPSYDVFVSYRQHEPDLSWVRGVLVPRLQADNLRVFIDYESFRLGVPIVKEMGRGVELSRYTVAVITPRYLESGFADLESVLAQHLGLEQKEHRLVPVLRETSAPWLGIRAVLGIDMSDDATFEIQAAKLCAHLHTDAGGR